MSVYSVSHICRLRRLFQCRDITTGLRTYLIIIWIAVKRICENCVKIVARAKNCISLINNLGNLIRQHFFQFLVRYLYNIIEKSLTCSNDFQSSLCLFLRSGHLLCLRELIAGTTCTRLIMRGLWRTIRLLLKGETIAEALNGHTSASVSHALENNRIERFIESVVAYWTTSSFSHRLIASRFSRTIIAIPPIRSSRDIIECEMRETGSFVVINVFIKKKKRLWFAFIKS